MHLLIHDALIEAPPGWLVVLRGVVQAGDRAYDPESGTWLDETDDDYFGVGDDVRDFYCVVRREPQ